MESQGTLLTQHQAADQHRCLLLFTCITDLGRYQSNAGGASIAGRSKHVQSASVQTCLDRFELALAHMRHVYRPVATMCHQCCILLKVSKTHKVSAASAGLGICRVSGSLEFQQY